MSNKKPVRLEKVEDKSPWIWRLQVLQTILIIILMIGVFILIATIIGGWENAGNWYNYKV